MPGEKRVSKPGVKAEKGGARTKAAAKKIPTRKQVNQPKKADKNDVAQSSLKATPGSPKRKRGATEDWTTPVAARQATNMVNNRLRLLTPVSKQIASTKVLDTIRAHPGPRMSFKMPYGGWSKVFTQTMAVKHGMTLTGQEKRQNLEVRPSLVITLKNMVTRDIIQMYYVREAGDDCTPFVEWNVLESIMQVLCFCGLNAPEHELLFTFLGKRIGKSDPVVLPMWNDPRTRSCLVDQFNYAGCEVLRRLKSSKEGLKRAVFLTE